jgi:thiol-disulfide isomerase/thioredoxin
MNRRNWMLGGAAAAAALAGAGVAWRRVRPHESSSTGNPAASATAPAAGGEDPVASFWAMHFETPDGQPFAASSLRGRPLLVNFWATWCPPCVEELPLLDNFYRTNRARGWQVLGLAVDQPSAVRKWLQQKPLGFQVGMAGFGGTELSKSLGNIAGSLPFTALFGGSGQLLHRKVGKVTTDDLAQWVTVK